MPASPLIDAEQLRLRLDRGQPAAVLDVRWQLAGGSDRDAYVAGHIPGAAFVDLERELSGAPGVAGRHPLPQPDVFVAAMRAAGVRSDAPVVVYDDAGGLPAARAWWLLRHYGHGEARLLDGGVRAWIAAGGELASGDEPPAAGNFHGRPGCMPLLDAAGAAALAAGARGALLDVRAPERFRGEVEPLDPVAGHIPGARNWPMARNLGPDGLLLSPAALRDTLTAVLGTDAAVEVGTYCGSGITAAHAVLALELAGIEAALYPGSWSEWIVDPARPAAVGPR